jgi:DNA-binding CsgD family transcriptional regulator
MRFVLACADIPGLLLSPRERELVTLAAAGKTNKEIAHEIGLAHATVRVLLARAAAKLGAKSRRELLVKWAK